MKKLKFLLLGLLTASLAGALAACSGEETTYTFTFDARNGSANEQLELAEGAAVTRPEDPTKQLFTFDDWYTDTTFATVYTFGTMPAHDVTVYANWLPQSSVRVSYDSMGGSAVDDSVGVVGSEFPQPEAPEREGYVFMGWYTQDDTRFTFDAFPDSNTTLYAHWERDTGNYAFITFIGNGRQLADPVPVPLASTFEDPGFFGDDEIVTLGWFTNASLTTPYQGGTVARDMTLYTAYYTRGLTFSVGTVTGYTGTAQQVIVPSVVPGGNASLGSLTAVGDGAFRATDVTSVLLPENIVSVGAEAFHDCRYLVSVNLTQSVTTLGESAFSGAMRLKSYGDISSVTVIPDGCFADCQQLEEITLSPVTTSVGARAFSDCKLITQIVLPGNVASIGDQAFDGCTLLTQVTLPSTVTQMGTDVFVSCPALTGVEVTGNGNSVTLEGGNLYFGTQLVRCFAGEEGDTSFTLPAGKTAVAAYAFENAPAFTAVDLSGATQLVRGSLYGLNSLVSLTLPSLDFGGNGYLAAGFGATQPETSVSQSFYIPATLTTVALTDDVAAVADYAFYGATALSAVTGLDSVTSIGDGAFAYTAMTAFTIPATVTSFGARVFEGCDLDAYTVAVGNNTLSVRANGCLYQGTTLVAVPTSLTEVTIADTATEIAPYAFFNSAAETLTVPSSVQSIGYAALGNMQSLTSLSVPVIGDGEDNSYMGYVFGSEMSIAAPSQTGGLSSLSVSRPGRLPSNLKSLTVTGTHTSIPDMAFAMLQNVTQITIENDGDAPVTSYGDFSYYRTAVTEQTFAEGVTHIGESAFRETRLTSVSLPGSLGGGAGAASFSNIPTLADIELEEGITQIADAMFYASVTAGETNEDDGYSYNVWRSLITSLTIPSSVVSIGASAFYGVGMQTYMEPAAPDYQPLAYTQGTRNAGFTVTFAANGELTQIGAYAFAGGGAQTLALPASLSVVSAYAFFNNLYLENVTFGGAEQQSSLSQLWAYAFDGCGQLVSATIHAAAVPAYGLAADPEENPEAQRVSVFSGTAEGFTLYVPSALVAGFTTAVQAAGEDIIVAAIAAAGGEA